MHLIDTSVIMPCLRRSTKAGYLGFLNQLSEEEAPAISVITCFEVIAGTASEFLETNTRFLDGFFIMNVSRDIANLAGRLFYEWARKGRPLQPNDLLIGSSALAHGLMLVTTNRIQPRILEI